MIYKRLSTVTEFEQGKLERTIEQSRHVTIKELLNIPVDMLSEPILKKLMVIGENPCITYLYHLGLIKGDIERVLYLTRKSDFSNLIEVNLELYSERISITKIIRKLKSLDINYDYVTKDNITEDLLMSSNRLWSQDILNSDTAFNIYKKNNSPKLLNFIGKKNLGEKDLKNIQFRPNGSYIVTAGNFHPYLLQKNNVSFCIPLGDRYNNREYYRQVLEQVGIHKHMLKYHCTEGNVLDPSIDIDIKDLVKIIHKFSNEDELYDKYLKEELLNNLDDLFTKLSGPSILTLIKYLSRKYDLEIYLKERYPYWILLKDKITEEDIRYFLGKQYNIRGDFSYSKEYQNIVRETVSLIDLSPETVISAIKNFYLLFGVYNANEDFSKVYLKEKLSIKGIKDLLFIRGPILSTSTIKKIYPCIFSDLKCYWKEDKDSDEIISILLLLNKNELNSVVSLTQEPPERFIYYAEKEIPINIPAKKIVTFNRDQILKLIALPGVSFSGNLKGASEHVFNVLESSDLLTLNPRNSTLFYDATISNSLFEKFGYETLYKFYGNLPMRFSPDINVRNQVLFPNQRIWLSHDNAYSFIELFNSGDIEEIKKVAKVAILNHEIISEIPELYNSIYPYFVNIGIKFRFADLFLLKDRWREILRRCPAFIVLLESHRAEEFLDIPGVSDYIPKSWVKLKTLCKNEENVLLSNITFLDTRLKTEVNATVCQRCLKDFLISLLSDEMVLYIVKPVSREGLLEKCSCCE